MKRHPSSLTNIGAVAALASELSLDVGQTMSTVQLFAMGEQETRNGVPPRVVIADRAHAEAIVASSLKRAGNSDIVIDFDHQTVFAASAAGRAEAAGWIKALRADDRGIFADVEWTAAAAAKLADKAYRYISPYFTFDKASGRVRTLINAGLTNTPNLELAAVASALTDELFTEEDEPPMSFAKIALLLGYAAASAATVTEDSILADIGKLKAKADGFDATASALGVEIGDDLTAVATAATSLKSAADAAKPDPAKYVPIAAVAELQTGLASAQAQLDQFGKERRQAKIDAAVAEGRLQPALKAHAETLDDTALASFLGALPATGLGKSTVNGEPAGGGQLTDDERATASSMGLTEEEYLAAKDH